jgi:hypothetical protein
MPSDRKYHICWRTSVSGLPWAYDFMAEDDDTALEFVKRHAVSLHGAPSLMSLDLWDISNSNNPRIVAAVSTTEPTARVNRSPR